jgi:hypothetical protein
MFGDARGIVCHQRRGSFVRKMLQRLPLPGVPRNRGATHAKKRVTDGGKTTAEDRPKQSVAVAEEKRQEEMIDKKRRPAVPDLPALAQRATTSV